MITQRIVDKIYDKTYTLDIVTNVKFLILRMSTIIGSANWQKQHILAGCLLQCQCDWN